jgi:hypothetical protein
MYQMLNHTASQVGMGKEDDDEDDESFEMDEALLHQGGRKPVHIKMTLFGLYLICYQPHLSIFESF